MQALPANKKVSLSKKTLVDTNAYEGFIFKVIFMITEKQKS
jgi:hypothetical protein